MQSPKTSHFNNDKKKTIETHRKPQLFQLFFFWLDRYKTYPECPTSSNYDRHQKFQTFFFLLRFGGWWVGVAVLVKTSLCGWKNSAIGVLWTEGRICT